LSRFGFEPVTLVTKNRGNPSKKPSGGFLVSGATTLRNHRSRLTNQNRSLRIDRTVESLITYLPLWSDQQSDDLFNFLIVIALGVLWAKADDHCHSFGGRKLPLFRFPLPIRNEPISLALTTADNHAVHRGSDPDAQIAAQYPMAQSLPVRFLTGLIFKGLTINGPDRC
jgi:hypothetical protein